VNDHRINTCRQSPAAARRLVLRALAGLGCAILILLAAPCAAQSQLASSEGGMISREYPLKALFLYNFGGYVEWPAESFVTADQPFVIGILGNAPLDDTLRELAQTKKVAGRRIVVEQFPSVDSVRPCQILFIARDVSPQQERQVLASLQSQPVLLVGESPGFASRGGCVNFYIEANKIRFEINIEAARQQHLRISSKLLALARIVQ
jgi:hypothetical protein